MVDSILDDLIRLKLIEHKNINLSILDRLQERDIDKRAKEIAQRRGYPFSLGEMVVESL